MKLDSPRPEGRERRYSSEREIRPRRQVVVMAESLFASLPKRVTVVEVGPRDGLQNEKGVISTEAKIRFIDMLSAAGFSVVEATSFVSPKAIPQLADAGEVMAGITRREGTRYAVLVPNARAWSARWPRRWTRWLSSPAPRRRLSSTTSAPPSRAASAVPPGGRDGAPGGLACARLHLDRVRLPLRGRGRAGGGGSCGAELVALGVEELSIGDTIGVATPAIRSLRWSARLLGDAPVTTLAMHFHDTRGTALANVLAALQLGIATFDSSSGGLGGCPYAPGASGNLATEDLLYLLHGMGIETGVDLDAVVEASRYLAGVHRQGAGQPLLRRRDRRVTPRV